MKRLTSLQASCGKALHLFLLILAFAPRAEAAVTKWEIIAQKNLYTEQIITQMGMAARAREKTGNDPAPPLPNWVGYAFGPLVAMIEIDGPTKLGLVIESEPYLEPSIQMLALQKPGRYYLAPTLDWIIDGLYSITQTETLSITFRLFEGRNETPRELSSKVQIHPLEEWCRMWQQTATGEMMPRTESLAAYFNESHPSVDLFLGQVLEKAKLVQFRGPQAEDEDQELKEARTIWTALERRGFRYRGTMPVHVSADGRSVWQIRLQDEAVLHLPGTDVEGCLLLAAFFQHLGWECRLHIAPDKCLVEVRLKHYGPLLLDPTELGKGGDLEDVAQAAQKRREAADADFAKGDTHFTVDLAKARREGVPPLRLHRPKP